MKGMNKGVRDMRMGKRGKELGDVRRKGKGRYDGGYEIFNEKAIDKAEDETMVRFAFFIFYSMHWYGSD